MSSRLGTAPRSTTRRLLATAALAVVLGLGVSMSAPAGSASAAPAAPTSSSAAQADPIAASQADPVERTFYVSPRAVDNIKSGTLQPRALAGLVCTQFHSGLACVKSLTLVLEGGPGTTDPRTCQRGQGFTISYYSTHRSHCGR